MRFSSILSEAARNLRAGASRGLSLAVLLALSVGALAVADVRGVASVLSQSQEYRESGASVWIVEAQAGVVGSRCESLALLAGVTASGATRDGLEVRASTLPSLRLATVEATPGLLGILNLNPLSGGVALPETLASDLGRPTGLLLTDGRLAAVSGEFSYPDDGRIPTLEYSVLLPVAASGSFDACWAEFWPSSSEVTETLSFSLDSPEGVGDSGIVFKQFNPTLGDSLDEAALVGARPTKSVIYGAALAGLIIGGVSVRTRRLELASARHAGVSATSIALQIGVETAFWAAAGALIATPVVWVAARNGIPGLESSVWAIGLRSLAVAAASSIASACFSTLLIRERHLFKYFKGRV